MSSIRKSASFRSRIPVRRTKPLPRRCYSPPPLSTVSSSAEYRSSHSHKSQDTSQAAATTTASNKYKQKHPIWLPQQLNTSASGPTMAANKVATATYSSSSYSSSDESQESEAPLQFLLKQSSSTAGMTRPSPLNESTDAMSLDGLLDSVSCGSFSSPPSPTNLRHDGKSFGDDPYTSYDSLDKYNYALETLKLTDNNTICLDDDQHSPHALAALNKCMLQPKCRQPVYVHNENGRRAEPPLIGRDIEVTPQLPPRPPLPRSPSSVSAKDMEKQQQLSDWYYIKSNSKSPLPPPRPDKRNGAARAPVDQTAKHNQSDGIYVKNPKTMLRDPNKNNIQTTRTQRDDNCNFPFRNGSNKSDADSIDNRNADDIRCKFNAKSNASNGEQQPVNGFAQWHREKQMLVTQSAQQQLNVHQFHERQQKKRIDNGAPTATHPFSVATASTHPTTSSTKVQAELYEDLIHPSIRLPMSSRYGELSSGSFERVSVSNYLSSSTAMVAAATDVPPTVDKRFNKSTGNFTDEQQLAAANGAEHLQRKAIGVSQPIQRRRPPPPPIPTSTGVVPVALPAAVAAMPSGTDTQNLYPPKSTSYRSECELFGSYVSLECPSPPGPPACMTDSRRDPQARLSRFLKVFYTELALKEPLIPSWAHPTAPGALCPARLEPDFRLHSQSHGFSDPLTVEQLLTPIQTKDGQILEAPRRLLIECAHWVGRNYLALRILHAWAKEPPWPVRGTPVALAIFLPLAEMNNKKSIANFVEKELLSKGPNNPFASGFGGFSSAWSSLAALGPKLLFVIDGYDNVRGTPKRKAKNVPQDIVDLLEGKLFPESRIIIISISQTVIDILPLVQRHVKYEGLAWGRSASLLGGGQWGAPPRLLDAVQASVHLRQIARTPFGCLALAAIYAVSNGDMPTEEIDVIESVMSVIAPDATQAHVAELGRLALFSLKTKRAAVTSTEIKMYCSNPDSSILGCFDKALVFGKSAKKKNEFVFTPVCAGIVEFLAANYIASLANRPGLLAAEITGLSLNDEVEPEILKVLTFAMSLLGPRAHILLSKLTPLWLSPQTVFSLALGGGDSTANLHALCDLLGISKTPPISPLETNPIWVQIRSTPNEMLGWAMALKSPNCTLKNLELSYQSEKNTTLDARNSMEVFLDALSLNESVSTLRITSLIENDAKEADINVIANCVSRALLKPRLENFELILTLLEEDPPLLKLQSVVTALCRSMSRPNKICSMLLDLGLCTSQLVQVCSVLEKCPQVTRLSLPHLRCERGAVGALAQLLNSRPLASLALPSCWGARDDPPSSSGVSMGSGSGSSTGTSGILKQSSLTGAPSPRTYSTGLFSSLPRGAFVPSNTMGRSATLPRQPLDLPPDKRSSDSVVSKTWYPTPACDGGPHNSGTLHELLLAAREPYSRLHGLDLSKAQLSLEDSMCLGETVRVSSQLHSIKLEGSSRVSEVLPTMLGAGESVSLQMMSLASPRLALEDGATAMSARALANSMSLRLLSLDGWSFRVDNSSTMSAIRVFLTFTSVRELGLSNCRLHLPGIKADAIPPIEGYECRSVVVLKMSGAQVVLADHHILRGPQLLPYLSGFRCLRELDLSAPARSGLTGSTSTPFILDDKCITSFFQSLHTHFGMLNTLKMCNWILHLDDASKTMKTIAKAVKNSPLSHVKIDGISVMDLSKKTRIEPSFFHMLLSSLSVLRWLGISLAGKKDEQITAIGNAVLDIRGSEIDIRLSESTIEGARLMAQAISLDSKFDVRVSTFGTSSGILVHAEKFNTKSLSRKH